MKRLFIGIPISNMVGHALISEIQDQGELDASAILWTLDHNFHITVKFLGDTELELVDNIKLLMDQLSHSMKPVQGTIECISRFPDEKAAHVAAELQPLASLEQLHQAFNMAFLPLGFQRENRAYRPHITLGRIRNEANISLKHSLKVEIAQLILYESIQQKSGLRYWPLHTLQF